MPRPTPELALMNLVAHGRLERLGAVVEPLAVRCDSSLTVWATCESAAGPASASRSKIAATGFSTGESSMRLVAARQVDVVDLLVAKPGERRLLARHGRHLVAPAAHELEERRRELVAPGDDLLREQRGHERGGEVVGRRRGRTPPRCPSRARGRSAGRRTPRAAGRAGARARQSARIQISGWWSVSSTCCLSRAARSAAACSRAIVAGTMLSCTCFA